VHFDEHNVVQPDLFFIRKDDPKCVINDEVWFAGPPDICIEILSPESTKLDRVLKFDLYAQFGVPEYWLVELDGQFIEVYVLTDGRYQRHAAYNADATLTSPTIPAITVPLAEIFPR
jgi:Uma2 family endonuclease